MLAGRSKVELAGQVPAEEAYRAAVADMAAALEGANVSRISSCVHQRQPPSRRDQFRRLYGSYSLGKGVAAVSACTRMLVTRQPLASLTA